MPSNLKVLIKFILFAAHVKKLIESAMNQFHQKTCIRFIERTNEFDYVYITAEKG